MPNFRVIRNRLTRWLVVLAVCSISFLLLVGLVKGLQPENALSIGVQSTETGNYEELQKLFLANGESGDEFGTFIDMDGDFAVISAYRRDVGENVDEGAVYVYRRTAVDPEKWELVTELTADDGSAFSEFGVPVAISGNYVAVGAPFAQVDGVIGSPGAVYLFSRNEGGVDNWGQLAKISADDVVDGDLFGHWLSIEGEYLVVGAPSHDSNEHVDQGAVYIFHQQSPGSTQWNQMQKLMVDDGIDQSGFGSGLDMSGNTMVVGAENFNYQGRPGVAYVFNRESDMFTPTKKLTVENGLNDNLFGTSISLKGDTALVGAPNNAPDSSSQPGSAYIFERDAGGVGNWGMVKEITAVNGTEDNGFGDSVSIWNDIVVVGAPGSDAAYMYHRDAGGFGNWGQISHLTATDNITNENEQFGLATVVEGETVLIGARYTTIEENDNQGAAYVFQVVPSFEVTVSPLGSGTGIVTSSLSGIDCGITCTASFSIGEVVTLTAVSDLDSIFTGWSGACFDREACVLPMTQTQQVTATFSIANKIYLPLALKD